MHRQWTSNLLLPTMLVGWYKLSLCARQTVQAVQPCPWPGDEAKAVQAQAHDKTGIVPTVFKTASIS